MLLILPAAICAQEIQLTLIRKSGNKRLVAPLPVVLDVVQISDGVIAAGALKTLTSASGNFTAAMKGRTIIINGAAGSSPLLTTIATYNSPKSVSLTHAASNAVSGAVVTVGMDNTASINAALAAVGTAGGGSVLLPAGTFLVTNTLYIPSFVTLAGASQSTTTLLNPSGTALAAGMLTNTHYSASNVPPFHYALDSGITITNLTLDGQNPIIGTPVNNTFYGMAFYGVTDLNVENVTVRGTRGQGIITNFSKSVHILHNKFYACGLDCIQMQDTSQFLIENNFVNGTGDFAIEVNSGQWATGVSSGYGSVTNNEIHGYSTVGIGVRGSNDAASSNPGHLPVTAVKVSHNTVNTPRLSRAGGITFYGSVTASSATDNSISGSGSGIVTAPEPYNGFTATSSGLTISTNKVTGNTLGMGLYMVSSSKIAGNTVTGNTSQGVILAGQDNTFSANDFSGNNTSQSNLVVSSLGFSGGTGYPASFSVHCTGGAGTAVVTVTSSRGVPNSSTLQDPGYGFTGPGSCAAVGGTSGSGATFTPTMASAVIVLTNGTANQFMSNRIMSLGARYTSSVLETGYTAGTSLFQNQYDKSFALQGHGASVLK